jgi:Rieske Fe-S protein
MTSNENNPPQGSPLESTGEDDNMSRFSFLRGTVALVATAWGTMTLFPVYQYLKSPGDEAEESHVASVDLGDKSRIPPGTGKIFKFGSIPGIITCTLDGEYHAFSAICTHLGCTVQFREDKQEIWCACHGGCYDAATGKNIAGPPPRPLKPLTVNIVNDKIVVSKA